MNEKINVAELRALGLFYMTVVKPLWDKIKRAGNIFNVNDPLNPVPPSTTVKAASVERRCHTDPRRREPLPSRQVRGAVPATAASQ